MAEMGSLNVSLKDYKGKSGRMSFEVPKAKATIANAKKVAEYAQTHSDARVVGYGISVNFKGDETDRGQYDRCLQRLEFSYEDAEGNSRKLGYPAPRDEDVNDHQEPESDVAEDFKDLLVSVGVLVAPVAYNGGGLKSRLPKAGARATDLTGI